jgi:NTP pyrophosphatase (non-canonical NTP hydrolase)
MNLNAFQKINAERGRRWHRNDLNQWSLLEWAGAMCGEAGEAANYAKKIRRLEIGLPNREAGLQKSNRSKLEEAMAREIADTIIYGLLALSVLEVDAAEIIADTFDQKSIEYGFPERAPR